MLDLFNVKLPAGFPDHPHRGFETVTYMLSGKVLHEDFKGHKGEIGPGDIQWMTAGKGIVHAEMPSSFDESSYGFQLWINLHAANKFCEPQYQEFKSEKIPSYTNPDSAMTAKVISGEVFGVKGPIVARTPTYFIDFIFSKAGTVYEHVIPKGWNSMLVIYKGSTKVQEAEKVLQEVTCVPFLVSDSNQTIRITTVSADTRIVLLAG
jgi:quercetin 2,3-dioxygenase